jgi:hypothetical protein
MADAPPSSGWNVDTLKAHIDTRFDDLRRSLDERYSSQVKAVEDALKAQQTAVQAALLAQKEQSAKGDIADEKRFDLLNELRTGVATKEQIEALEKLITDLTSRVDKKEGHSGGVHAGWLIFTSAVGVIAIIYAMTRGG